MLHNPYFALAVLLCVSAITGCSRIAADAPPPKPTVFPVEVLKTKILSGFSYPTTFYGRIHATRRTSLAFEIPGQIIELLVDEGDVIEAGKPVARLNTSILDAERNRLVASKAVEQTVLRRLEKGEREEVVSAARAMVNRMDAELEQAVRDRDRLQKLLDQNAISVSEYESSLFKAKSLQASTDAVKARLLELETGTREEDLQAQQNRLLELDAQIAVLDSRLSKAVLTAPFDAHVIQRIVDEGGVVQEGQPILVLSEADRLEARFSVPVTQLKLAQAADTIFSGNNPVPVLKVRTISSVSDQTRTVTVIYELPPTKSFLEGQTCTLNLTETVTTTCVELPMSALVPSVRGLWSVYRLEQDRESENFRLIREEVTIDHTDGDRVFVETSLPEGSLVVSEGLHKLVPGMLVRIKADEP